MIILYYVFFQFGVDWHGHHMGKPMCVLNHICVVLCVATGSATGNW